MRNAELESIIRRIAAKFEATTRDLERTRAELDIARAEVRRLRAVKSSDQESHAELTASDWSRLTR